MSTKSGYLRAAGKRYSFRRRVPSHLQALAGSSEVIRALGPITARDAQKQARILASATDEWFARLARGEACDLSALAPSSNGPSALALARPGRKPLASRVPAVSASSAGVPVGDAIERYILASEVGWTAKTSQLHGNSLRLFSSMLGTLAVASIERRHVAEFVAALQQLPARYACSAHAMRRTLPDLLRDHATIEEGKRGLAAQTIGRHLSALSGFFAWTDQLGLREGINPARSIKIKLPTGRQPSRRPWRTPELKNLFCSPVWTGCASDRAESGPYVIGDARYWLPLLALFTGMRLEEICKLGPDDVREVGGFWVLDVVANERGRVKEDASNRTVPVHPLLVQLGFIEHVAARQAAGTSLLWPELHRAGPDKRLGSAFTKWFGRYCTRIGLSDPALTCHSFRKNLATALHRAGVSETIAADILGHAHKTTSYRIYSQGTAAKPLCKVEYDLDLSHLIARSGS